MKELDGYMLEEVMASNLTTGDVIWSRFCRFNTKWESVTVSLAANGKVRLSTFSGEEDVAASKIIGRRCGFADLKVLIDRWARGDASQDQVDHLIENKMLYLAGGRVFKTAKGEMLLGR
ncbi:hypothetical protein IPT12_05225 [Xanthomonas perforans]|uniref:Uncharacterized protein n=1 Tax=Xanthomonas perforans TaxID=442694 RepID=A0A6L9VKU4_XANPE|nr:hypothetical protein [Xanthomonas perforans]MBZ2411851.1 hypothetical protein [Xanthomonas perforans]MBZ2415956.1 hypothetical protein [Xanthomonas perforans]MBZ2420433.1 hypothetical protein [Xanthomonas perforans]MBZ2424724.1 hypothetical protein [Xanthomonas perforans]MBZ2429531.1 hypothetical protein [Xanthomonas perforans]